MGAFSLIVVINLLNRITYELKKELSINFSSQVTMSDFERLPENALSNILLRVPSEDLIRSCNSVCKVWYNILSVRYFWVQKLRLEGKPLKSENKQLLLDHANEDLCLYVLQAYASDKLPFNTNLIKNPCGRDKFKHWYSDNQRGNRNRFPIREVNLGASDETDESDEQINSAANNGENSSDDEIDLVSVNHPGFAIQKTPHGSLPIPEEVGVPTQHCFVTSYHRGRRTQKVDFTPYNIREGVMELLKPTIRYSQWVSARFDCQSEAELYIRVKSGLWKMEPESRRWVVDQDGFERRSWYKMEGSVQCDRYVDWITYHSDGQDRQFWAGNYGSKTTASWLSLDI